jgi:cytochrome c-type protein NapC
MLLFSKFSRGIAGLLVFAVYVPVSLAVDWGGISGKDIDLFYPGQASWEWALTQNSHAAAAMVRQGRACRACHSGQEQMIGNKIISGGNLEPQPLTSIPGSIKINVKAALEEENLYIQISWPANKGGANQGQGYQSRVSIILDDGNVAESSRAGCWSACHSDNSGMSDASASLSKYLARSRSRMTRTGGGENYKSDTELEDLLKDKIFMEYWMAGLNTGEAPVVIDGYILDRRYENQTPIVTADAQLEDNIWTVTFKRPLDVDAPHYKTIESGKTYQLGLAVHNNYSSGRQHYVSFEYLLTVGHGKADFVAVQ